jgi:hypothetical protein
MPRPEYWTMEQVAEYLDIQVASVSTWLYRHGIHREYMVKARDVREAKQRSPGQGARTDLARRHQQGEGS